MQPEILETHRDGLTISTDPARLDLEMVRSFLADRSYWAKGIPFPVVKKALENSLCFGVYEGDQQVGLARVITDYATFAYVADVFILEAYRGRGLSKWLMAVLMSHPDLQGLRMWLLFTRDAHGLYSQYGFETVVDPDRIMVIRNRDIYLTPPTADPPQE